MIDKRYPNLELQVKTAREELLANREMHKESTLHCVRATQKMINVLKEVRPEPKTVLWHSFNGSCETAKELFKLGIIISISPKCTKNIKKLFESNPLFVLETDYEGNNEAEHNEILTKHYKKIATELNMTVEELEEHCRESGCAFKN